MNPKTFIEIWYDSDEANSNWFATKSISYWKDESPYSPLGENTWNINGSSLSIYDKHDLAALRQLLDAIEEELSE